MNKPERTTFDIIKIQLKQNLIAITSLFVALIGVTVNIAYMEHKERNSNLRMASFQLLIELSALEEITFHLQYDQESSPTNARTGWVKVRLIAALTSLMPKPIQISSTKLSTSWANNWEKLGTKDQQGADEITEKITQLRELLISTITKLE